jgi:hypothetical protein
VTVVNYDCCGGGGGGGDGGGGVGSGGGCGQSNCSNSSVNFNCMEVSK